MTNYDKIFCKRKKEQKIGIKVFSPHHQKVGQSGGSGEEEKGVPLRKKEKENRETNFNFQV